MRATLAVAEYGRFLFLVAAVVLVAAANTADADAGPGKSEPFSFWKTSDETNAERIDHSDWQKILDKYLQVRKNDVNRFKYPALKANAEDTAALAGYIKSLRETDPRKYSRAEQKAYWINFYNALTVKAVADAYPVESIMKVSISGGNGPVSSGPWDEEAAKVAGRSLTLNNIEHDILRPLWKDNLIHYGVSCASYGCPSLQPTAFTAENTGRLLNEGARLYVNHPRGVNFMDDDFLIISSIYDWYAEDFGGGRKGVIEHLVRYANKNLAKRLRKFTGTVDYEYDWKLNQP